jgi:hypothetical protein
LPWTAAATPYDASRPLVIDPLVLGYSTYLGGSGDDSAAAVAVDAIGRAYVTGATHSVNFPATPGAFDSTYGGNGDAFVAKLNASGSGLVYATYLGAAAGEAGNAIAVDDAGAAYVTGVTQSPGFPVTPGSFQTTYHGGIDAFAVKLTPDGSGLAYGTFLGGGKDDFGNGIAVDGAGDAFITGRTKSYDFPVTPGAFETTYEPTTTGGTGFVTELNAAGSSAVYSTFLGGHDWDNAGAVAVDAAGSAYVSGSAYSHDFPTTPGSYDPTYPTGAQPATFVVKFNPGGGSLAYGTFLGGAGGSDGLGIYVDGAGNAYATGQYGGDFPFTVHFGPPTGNAFVAKFSADGSQLVYSVAVGGNFGGVAVAVDAAGNAYMTGTTNHADFPTTPDAFQANFKGVNDAFLTEVNAAGTALAYSTYLGGSNDDWGYGVAADGFGNVYVAGKTDSADFPTTPSAFKRRNRNGVNDAFVTKFALA